MIKLLKKEFRLAMHPIAPLMILLSSMVMIPNYPYSVIFFYVSMGIFFTCLLGRENNDVVYSLTLPVAKKDIVKARIGFAVVLEMIQLVVTVPLAILSQSLNKTGNQAGMDANITFFAVGFIIYGCFNFVYFKSYYKNVNKVGFCFVESSIVIFVLVLLEVVATHAIPFARDYLDTKDPNYLTYKLIALAIGIVTYIFLTYRAYKISKYRFETQDL
ncbi:MAG: ABC-2 transporter permease [Clostridiales bacterium]|nr:ABC-2 transporter permease [Clostridiales bacterium]